jgi:hypothetical protein
MLAPGKKGRKGFHRERNRRFRSLWAAARRSQSGRAKHIRGRRTCCLALPRGCMRFSWRAWRLGEKQFLRVFIATRPLECSHAKAQRCLLEYWPAMVYKNERSPGKPRMRSSGWNFVLHGWEPRSGSEKHKAWTRQAAHGGQGLSSRR